MYIPMPTKPPTRMEMLVALWAMILALSILGGILLYVGLTAPPAAAADASKCIWYGAFCVGGAVAVWLIMRGVRWLQER